MKKNIIIGCLGALLLALGVLYMHSRQNDKARIHELEAKVVVLQKQGETSELDRSVSEQMEDIAHGQQALSEERSQEAIRQSEIAEAERQHVRWQNSNVRRPTTSANRLSMPNWWPTR